MSGMLTCRGSLQLASGTSNATPTSASSFVVCLMVLSSGSEGHVDASQELPDRRLRQEVGDTKVELPDVVDLGIRAAVIGPGHEVASRGREAQRARAELRSPFCWGEVGQRDFPQLDESAVLEESGLHCRRR